MKDFNDIQHMWQQQPPGQQKIIDYTSINKMPAGIKAKLLRQQATGIVVLALIIALIIWVAFFNHFFKRTITYVGLLMAAAVIIMQLIIMLYTYIKIKKISDMLSPALHLQQWETYYSFRKKQLRWNMPLYFISLNISMCLYLAEAIVDHFNVWVGILCVIYIALMLFTYLVLEKMSLAREEKRLQRIIAHLDELSRQLKPE